MVSKAVKDYLEAGRKLRQMTRAFGPILIVEDDAHIADLLKRIVEFHGLKAKVTNHVDDAMTYIHENHDKIRCVVLDLHLRGEEGEQVLQFIETKHSRVPYLVYTCDMKAGHAIEEKFPRATVLKKGDSIQKLVEALGFNGRPDRAAC